jgi:hypothetical protein
MQTSKLIVVVCACALLTGLSLLRAAESEAQRKAREALRQKMQEGQPQPAAPAPVSPPPQAVTPAPPPKAEPVAPAPQTTPTVVTRVPDSEAQARARQALREKMNEGQSAQPVPPPVVATPAAPPPTAPPTSPPTTSPPTAPPTAPAVAWSPSAPDNPAQAKAREALEQKMRELDSQQPVAAPVAPVARPVATPGEPAYPPTVVFKPIEPPPSAFPTSKAGRLADLLSRYRADQITPEEYHTQRAAIVGEP